GRGNPQTRRSPPGARSTTGGPTGPGPAGSVEPGRPPGPGPGAAVSRAAALGPGPPSPPLGPLPRRVPPNGGSSGGWGRAGGMIVISPCGRSMRHDPLNARTMIATCTAPLATQVSRRNSGPGLRISNSGEHLSQPLGGLDQPRRADGECDTEKSFAAGPEPASGERHDPYLRERT